MTERTLEDAIALAIENFRGQVDKDGQPYILHLLRVMLQLEQPEARMVGLLHDIVEDTDVTIEDLQALGFSAIVLEAVDCMTHRSGISYADYIIRIRLNSTARACKLADLSDNYRLDRVAYRADHIASDARRLQRYVLSYQYLQDKIDEVVYRRLMQAVEG